VAISNQRDLSFFQPSDCGTLSRAKSAQVEIGRMKFVEITGKHLVHLVREDEMDADELRKLGVTDDSVVRINQQGDIELRRPEGWDVIGGLIGDFQNRIRKHTGMEWA
jgi:hypothetical protein